MKKIILICGFLLLPWIAYGATSNIAVTEGSGKNIATNSITEDAATKQLQRVVPNTSAGVEIAPLTDTQLRATAVPVSLATAPTTAVTGTFWQATQPVSGTFWQATQPVSVATIPSHAVTNAGTFAVQADLGANNDVTVTSGAITETNSGSIKTAVEAMNAKMVTGTDIGDVTINNAAAGAAVNIQDGGNTITVDGAVTVSGTATVTQAGTVTVDGAVTVDMGANNDVTVTSGAITETNSGTIAGDTTSIDGKITACNTGAVVLTNDSIVGAGDPTIDSYMVTPYPISAKTGANQVIISSAANKQIWVYGFGFTATVAGTVAFQDEDDAAHTGAMNIDALGGMVIAPSGNFAMPLFKLGTDKDLEADIVDATINGWVSAAIVSI